MTAVAENIPNILVVEDEAFFRQVIVDDLARGGFRSIEATSGSEVASILGREEIGLVLTDLEMPGVSGLEVLQLVKRLSPEIPVVVISSHQDFHVLREVLSGGALEYLVKPFADAELCSVAVRGLTQYRANMDARKNLAEAERLLGDLVLLREVGETASGEVNLQSLLDRITGMIVEAVGVQMVSLMLPASDGNLRIRASLGMPDGIAAKAVIKPGEGVSGHVYQTGEPVLLSNIEADGRFTPAGDGGQYSTSSALSLPLKGREKILGVLNVNNKSDGSVFSAHDQNLLASIAYQASLAIENFGLVNQLRNKARELEAINNARSRLVCTLSHELKTPLTSILGFADLLYSHRANIGEAELDDYLGKIADSSLHMDKLISGMLLLFSIDSGTASWDPEPLLLRSVCDGELMPYREQIEKMGLELVVDIAAGMPEVHADGAKFRLLVSALIDNAVKFNEPGGRLSIRAMMRNEGGQEQVYLQVFNDGIHVPIESAEEVFAQYSQLGEINTAKPEGIGIGLSLCRTITEKMGGSIFLEDTGGVGTSFGLLLPRYPLYKGNDDEFQ